MKILEANWHFEAGHGRGLPPHAREMARLLLERDIIIVLHGQAIRRLMSWASRQMSIGSFMLTRLVTDILVVTKLCEEISKLWENDAVIIAEEYGVESDAFDTFVPAVPPHTPKV
jgi:hypothetical protein